MNYLNLFLLCISLTFGTVLNASFQPQGVHPAEHVVITEKGGKTAQKVKSTPQENANQTVIKERKMFKPSKVKGFSKLALWTTIILMLSLIFIVFILFKKKKQVIEINDQLKREKSIPKVNIITSSEIYNNKELKKELADIFEDYMASKLDTNYYIKITGRSADKQVNGKYLLEDTYPDIKLEFSFKDKAPVKMAVECKYSTGYQNLKVTIAKDNDQLMRYKQYGNNGEKLVFIALGVGGPPNNPHELFIIPVDQIVAPVVERNDILIYKMDKPKLFFDPAKNKFNSFN
jgi:hypothetical protein